jgi:ATP-dependent RNA helicase DDX5/DBP2
MTWESQSSRGHQNGGGSFNSGSSNYNSNSRGGFGSGRGSGFKGQNNNAQPSLTGIDPSTLPPITKNLYKEHEQVTQMSGKDVEQFRKENEMIIKGDGVPKPVSRFDHVNFGASIMKKLAEQGFDKPTPIQAQGWPMALSGKNMVGIAQTGSGKTISYLLPALTHILAQPPLQSGDGPIALVLAPTRELAVQIQEVARQFGNAARVRNCCLYGGVPKGPQIRTVKQGAELYIATPGRLLDMMSMQDQQTGFPFTSLKRVSFLILDEADRMLDMGFEEPLREIIGQIRGDRQVLMWSATWPKAVRRLAEDILGRDFIQVTIGSQDLTANKKINQNIIVCRSNEKEDKLVALLQKLWDELPGEDAQKQFPRTIVFTNTKRLCDNLVHKMNADNWPAASMHGDKEQGERERVLRGFKSGTCPIMVCTDVAARGLDVRDVRVVINYDFPNNIEDYVHRIGRTARGKDVDGHAYSYFTEDDKGLARELVEIMKTAGQEIPIELQALVPKRGGNGGGNGGGRGGFGGRGRGRGGYNRFRPY